MQVMRRQLKHKKLYIMLGGSLIAFFGIGQYAQATCYLSKYPSGSDVVSSARQVTNYINSPQIYRGSTAKPATIYDMEYQVTCTGRHRVNTTPTYPALDANFTNYDTNRSNIIISYEITMVNGGVRPLTFDGITGKRLIGVPASGPFDAGTYTVKVRAAAGRGIYTEEYMRDYNGGESGRVVTMTPDDGSSGFAGYVKLGLTNFKRDPCASTDSFTLSYPNGKDIVVPTLSNKTTGPVKTKTFGIQVNLVRDDSKPDSCAALVEPEISFDREVIQLSTVRTPVQSNGFELRLYEAFTDKAVGRRVIKLPAFNPADGIIHSRMDFYAQVTRNTSQKTVVEGPFRGAMSFNVIYR